MGFGVDVLSIYHHALEGTLYLEHIPVAQESSKFWWRKVLGTLQGVTVDLLRSYSKICKAVSNDTMSKPAPNLSASVRDAFSGMSLCVVCWDIISTVDSATARMPVHSVPAGAWQLTRTLLLLFDV
ncbi:hypothetical protein CY34DRAFT_441441 [Suillus luteus UH-Slu-Lm8-n1]|uniref:Uncharacterized protein n=1 Tax=Suillus luteus UH-Slu-Lm8-n1 TaxID=930992 RepID=A0A0D0BTB8_9AGAM|nr:hypothetical protein CY34DRAFT_441441 [Suillus luteus UH-Slu-Lm8-n1]